MGKTAVITGATSGIGAAYARRLAKDGHDLIITGRRKDVIQKVADEITGQYKNKVDVIIAELSNDRDIQKVVDTVKDRDDIDYLINNAGYSGYPRHYEETSVTEHEKMVKAHIDASLRLISAVLPGMKKRANGVIINVASMGAMIPLTCHTVYCGTKGFLKLYTQCLYLELKDSGIKVQVLCPGNVYTDWAKDYYPKDIYEKKMSGKTMPGLPPEKVVDSSLKSLKNHNPVCVPGFTNRMFAGIGVLMSTKTIGSLVQRMSPFR
jgi:uncharacterized protein